jgi:phage protein D
MATTASFLVEIADVPLSAEVAPLLISAYVDLSLRLPDSFMLRFRDPDHTVVERTRLKIGDKATVSVMTPDALAKQRLISAEVTSLEADYDSTGSFTVVRGYDPTHRLFRGRHTRSFAQVTASDAVIEVARGAGLKTGQVERVGPVFEHLAQCGQSDWEFLDAIAKQVGCEVHVHDGIVDFGKRKPARNAPSAGAQPSNPLILRLGSDLLRFRSIVTAAEQVASVEVRGWDVAQKLKIVSSVPAGTKSVELPTVTPAQMADAFGSPKYVASGVAYRTQAEADSAAAAIAEEIGSSFAEIDAVARGNPELRADVAILIEDAGVPFDGKYTITSARHRYAVNSGGYTTAFSVTGRQERSLYGLTGHGDRGSTGAGVVIAQVTDIRDPTEQGRVKLTFPWLSDNYVSNWARTVQSGAGIDRGAMAVPEVGDEVLVAFEQHDPQRPYVLGGLFNGVDKPRIHGSAVVDTGTGLVNRRSWVSRLGHRIDLLDDRGRSDGLAAETGDGKLQVALDAAAVKLTLRSDGTVLVSGAKGVVIDAASSKLELKGSQIELTSTQGVKIAGGAGDIEVDTSGALSLHGTTAKVAADGTAEFKATGGAAVISGVSVKIN